MRFTGLLFFCIFAGVFWGALAALTGPSWVVVFHPGTSLSVAAFLGGLAGFGCAILVVPLLFRKNRDEVRWFMLGMVSPLVVVISVVVPSLGSLIFFSCLALVFATVLARFTLPDVYNIKDHCQGCGYDLFASMELGRCPECSTSFVIDEWGDPCFDDYDGERARRRARTLLWSRVSLGVSLLVACVMMICARVGSRAMAFDDKVWAFGTYLERLAMAWKLVDGKVLVGLKEDEVTAKLGKPDYSLISSEYSLDANSLFAVSYDGDGIAHSSYLSTEHVLGSRPFDAEAWREADQHVRAEMAKDLDCVGDSLIRGKTKAEIVELLGPPDVFKTELWYHIHTKVTASSNRQQLANEEAAWFSEELGIVIRNGQVFDSYVEDIFMQ